MSETRAGFPLLLDDAVCKKVQNQNLSQNQCWLCLQQVSTLSDSEGRRHRDKNGKQTNTQILSIGNRESFRTLAPSSVLRNPLLIEWGTLLVP